MNSTMFIGDLFAWVAPISAAPSKQATAPATAAPSKIRRTCPFILKGAPLGGTGDLETLVIDGTKMEVEP